MLGYALQGITFFLAVLISSTSFALHKAPSFPDPSILSNQGMIVNFLDLSSHDIHRTFETNLDSLSLFAVETHDTLARTSFDSFYRSILLSTDNIWTHVNSLFFPTIMPFNTLETQYVSSEIPTIPQWGALQDIKLSPIPMDHLYIQETDQSNNQKIFTISLILLLVSGLLAAIFWRWKATQDILKTWDTSPPKHS